MIQLIGGSIQIFLIGFLPDFFIRWMQLENTKQLKMCDPQLFCAFMHWNEPPTIDLHYNRINEMINLHCTLIEQVLRIVRAPANAPANAYLQRRISSSYDGRSCEFEPEVRHCGKKTEKNRYVMVFFRFCDV